MRALVDGDIIRYRIGFACEKKMHEAPDGWTCSGKKEMNAYCAANDLDVSLVETWTQVDPVSHCLHSVKVFIEEIIKNTKSTTATIYLTGKGNFREELAVTVPYKGNRDRSRKPVHFDAITEYLINTWDAEVIEGMEADDAMAIEQTLQMSDEGIPDNHHTSVICSIDKDMLQVPGLHYNFNSKEIVHVTRQEGSYSFWKQMLTGDVSDNIKGLGKVGDKTATYILEGDSFYEYPDTVAIEYFKRGLSYERFIENAHLLFLIRELDKKGNPVHWQSPL